MHPFPSHFLSQAYQLRWCRIQKRGLCSCHQVLDMSIVPSLVYKVSFSRKSHFERDKQMICCRPLDWQLEKVILFQKTAPVGHQQEKKTHLWDGIHSVGKCLQHHCLIYRQARYAMLRLGVNQEKLDMDYWELHNDDLQTSTAVVEPNAQEQQKKELFWIWQKTGMNIFNQMTVVNECEFPNIEHWSMTTHSMILQYIE